MIYFTSDEHYYAKNIIKYCNRPFSSVEEMNEKLIENHNKVVSKNDSVYHLGDFCFANLEKSQNIFNRLNGNHFLILGNHCDDRIMKKLKWGWIKHYYELKVNKELFVLFHYSLRVWNKSHYGSKMLYGHSHGQLEPIKNSLDVGVDCWEYFPVSLEKISEKLSC